MIYGLLIGYVDGLVMALLGEPPRFVIACSE